MSIRPTPAAVAPQKEDRLKAVLDAGLESCAGQRLAQMPGDISAPAGDKDYRITDETIQDAVKVALAARGPYYVHPKYGPIASWDVSKVTNMGKMFHTAINFNGNISRWNVSNVTSMKEMFKYATNFNADLYDWDVSKVSDMNSMFAGAESFTFDLSVWNVSKVTDMREMFYGAESFTSDLSEWDVSKVTNMENMFRRATSYNPAPGRGLGERAGM